MMGVAQHNLRAPVVKGTNGLLAFTESAMLPKAGCCIRCARCVRSCPMQLLPLYMHAYCEKDMMPELDRMRITDCVECGCCSYICPARLHLVQSFRVGQQKLNAYMKKQNALSANDGGKGV